MTEIPLPSALVRAPVTWTLGHADTTGPLKAARGFVRFEASAIAVAYSDRTVLPSPVETPFVAGVMTPVDLIVNDPDIWNWKVTVKAGGVTWDPFHINVPAEGTNLASASITPGKGPVKVLKGDQGAQGRSITDVEQVSDNLLRLDLEDPATGEAETKYFDLPRGPEGPYGGTEVTDPQVASYIGADTATTAALDRVYRRGVSPIEYGAVGDGVADDTLAVEAAIAGAVARGLPLHSDEQFEYSVDPILVDVPVNVAGVLKLTARTAQQEYVLRISSIVDFQRARLIVNGAYRAVDAIQFANARRSRFGHVEAARARRWGINFIPTGNNNVILIDSYRAHTNGKRISATLTQTANTANVDTSSAGYSTLTIDTPLEAAHLEGAIYFVMHDGEPYKVRSVVDASTIEVLNLNVGVGNTASVVILAGGGVDISSYGDNGVGSWGSLDLSGNAVAIHIASLYGHSFTNAVIQANGIGVATSNYTLAATFDKPYFETNLMDIVSWSYLDGVIINPLMRLTRVRHLVSRPRGDDMTRDSRLIILKPTITEGGLFANHTPAINVGSRELRPGATYAFSRTNLAGFTYTIDDSADFQAAGRHSILLHLDAPEGSSPLTITTKSGDGTVQGAASYTGTLSGPSIVMISRFGTDWRVVVK